MNHPDRRNWPQLADGMYVLSLEFEHTSTLVQPTVYDNEHEARQTAKDYFVNFRDVRSVALIGRLYSGKMGILDVLEYGTWNSDADLSDMEAYEERIRDAE